MVFVAYINLIKSKWVAEKDPISPHDSGISTIPLTA
jgi:hypothetical protein